MYLQLPLLLLTVKALHLDDDNTGKTPYYNIGFETGMLITFFQ